MTTYGELAHILRTQDGVIHGVGVSEAEVSDAESAVGAFPSGYRQFLMEFGWVNFAFYQFWGLGADRPYPTLGVVPQTLRERELADLPDTMIAFYNNGGGDLACVRRADVGPPEDDAVYWHWHETRTIERASPSFPDFLAERLASAAERNELS
ncbi:MAG: hypothetical protein DI534_03155 [Leifsonia xyli]|nr:MAG: hypothetical protein DI534_03155 [Leifsonia xyli]